MKRHSLFFMLLVVFSAFALTACAGGKAPTQKDLTHHRFVLTSVDGQAYAKTEQLPEIEFLEGFRVAGSMCNRFTGKGELSGNTLTVKQMASTKKLCIDGNLNKLEVQLARMLQAGAEISLDNGTLTLKQGGHVLVYTAKDWVR